MVGALWALVVLVGIGLLVAIAVLVWLVVYLVRSRGEESDAPASVGPHACGGPDQCEVCDDWMAVADVVSDDRHPDDCDCTDISLEGVTPEDQAVFQRNWLALTDDERDDLNEAFDAIVEGADR